MKTYAYVKSQTCTGIKAVPPGVEVNGEPVSRHGDYDRWTYGKRETLSIAAGKHPHVHSRGAGHDVYMIGTARAVARQLGWIEW